MNMDKDELIAALKRATNWEFELTDEEIEENKDYDNKVIVAERLADELWEKTKLD